MARLQDKSGFSCAVLVDHDMHQSGKAKYQASRLKRLQDAGAKVYLCRGSSGRQSKFHWKDYVLDSRILYHGTCNMTYSSLRDDNFMVRLTGPVVKTALEGIQRARGRCVADSV